MALTTPSPPASRPHTPPTPLHGPRSDQYDPYSPRRSKRVIAQTQPYANAKSDRSPYLNRQRDITPPATLKKARFARNGLSQLSSPPLSPSSPVRQQQMQKTPRRVFASASKHNHTADLLSHGDDTLASLSTHPIDPTNMLPTPSKTPRKRYKPVSVTTARVLHFQPENPNDVMPSPRKSRPHRHNSDFDLYDIHEQKTSSDIEIFTDTNARVPEVDNTDDNPFIGPKRSSRQNTQKSSRAQRQQQANSESERMDEAVRNGEGVTYVFRGKKIFRRFKDSEDEAGSQTSGSDLGKSQEQRLLKRQAGDSAHRPLTRSMLKPRLLFPTEEERQVRERKADEIDEEALTDIDVSAFTRAKGSSKSRTMGVSPCRVHFTKDTTPLPPGHDASTSAAITHDDHAALDRNERSTPTADDMPVEAVSLSKPSSKRSPFDEWPRTKSGRKRFNDSPAPPVSRGKRRGAANID